VREFQVEFRATRAASVTRFSLRLRLRTAARRSYSSADIPSIVVKAFGTLKIALGARALRFGLREFAL